MGYIDEALNELDMYELGGALMEGDRPENLNVFGDPITFNPDVYEDIARSLGDLGVELNLTESWEDLPLDKTRLEGAGGLYTKEGDAITMALGKYKQFKKDDPVKGHVPHEVAHLFSDIGQIWPNRWSGDEFIGDVRTRGVPFKGITKELYDPVNNPEQAERLWDAYATSSQRGRRSRGESPFVPFTLEGGLVNVNTEEGTQYFAPLKDVKRYIKSQTDVQDYRIGEHVLKSELGDLTERTGETFKDIYGMWGGRDLQKMEDKSNIRYSQMSEFLAESWADPRFKSNVYSRSIGDLFTDKDLDSKVNIKDLVTITNLFKKSEEMRELSEKYGGFPDELWGLLEESQASSDWLMEYLPKELEHRYGIKSTPSVKKDDKDNEMYKDLK